MSERRIDAFFYGLFMDAEILRANGVAAENPRPAHVDDFGLRIGQRATLEPMAGSRSYGMLFALTHTELESLYYTLRQPPSPEERNPEYASRLQAILTKLGFPEEYVASVS